MKKILLILLLILINLVSAKEWITQDKPINYSNHIITVVDVNKDETKCGVNVDGNIRWIDKGDSVTINDVYIKVFDVIAVYTEKQDQDTCELLIAVFGVDEIPAEPVEEEVDEAVIPEEEVVEPVEVVEKEEVAEAEIIVESVPEDETIEEEPEKNILVKIIIFLTRLFFKK